MTDLEINATADGILLYLQEKCKDPMDALCVITCLALMFYERQTNKDASFPIEEFAKRFSHDLITFWGLRTVPQTTEGTETIQ